MRTKLFLAFFAIVLTALVSNLIFERLIIRDFEDYAMGAREDRIYWVLASVEGSRTEDGWDIEALRHYLHWAAMLGYDIVVKDSSGGVVYTSSEAIEDLSPSMRRRMEAIVHPDRPEGEAEEYPLFVRGEEIGSLSVRALSTEGLLKEKEAVFKKRGRDFLLISFLIAGGGAVSLSLVFSLFLTGPIRRLKEAAVRVASGDLTARVAVRSSDEIGELSSTFNHMVESLEREEALRKHLTANVAHELRTPLAVMKANIEAASDGVVELGGEALETLRSEVERLIDLVEGIEDMTRAEAAFFKQAEFEEVDLRAVLEGLAQGLRPVFGEKGLSLRVEERDALMVRAEVEKLETMIRNLLSNSLRHTASGGVTIDYGKHDGGFFVEVADTGSGIPEDALPFIFKRFYKGEGSKGVGLGLSIAKELVELSGGAINVKSARGEGSTFRVTMPAPPTATKRPARR